MRTVLTWTVRTAVEAGLVPERPDDHSYHCTTARHTGPEAPGGLVITAADVTTDRDDHGRLLPLIDQAAATTETPLAQVLADGGYHSAANLAACAAHKPPVPVLTPDPQAPRPATSTRRY